MSVVARFLSSGVARGFAALLAVLLSAVIGGRLGVDRLTLELADEESSSVACPLVVDGSVEWSDSHAVADVQITPDFQSLVTTGARPVRCDHLQAPALLCGSAGGPRAP
jgi:hypothetical protein